MKAIFFSNLDKAGSGIAAILEKEGLPSGWKLFEFERLLYIDEIPDGVDEIVCVSKHASQAKLPCFTVHVPGNWDSADFGGKPKTLNYSNPLRLRQIACQMKKELTKSSLGWSVFIEVDHHGPTFSEDCKVPIMFCEIGSSLEEWNDKQAQELVASAVLDTLDSKPEDVPVKLACGGGHYSPCFTPRMLEKQVAYAHLLPKYKADSFDISMMKQALEKTTNKVDGIEIDWKGLSSRQRNKVVLLSKDFGIESERL